MNSNGGTNFFLFSPSVLYSVEAVFILYYFESSIMCIKNWVYITEKSH